MCIYCGTNKYRKIYENHNGPIQREDNGRAYENSSFRWKSSKQFTR